MSLAELTPEQLDEIRADLVDLIEGELPDGLGYVLMVVEPERKLAGLTSNLSAPMLQALSNRLASEARKHIEREASVAIAEARVRKKGGDS